MTEEIKCILHNIKKAKSFGRWDAFNVAITIDRCIFAQLTSEMLQKAANEANQQGKEAGKGFLSRWGDQMSATLKYGDRYLTMDPEAILRENSDNFALDNRSIKSIAFKQKHNIQDKDSLVRRIYGEVTFDTDKGKTTYQIDGMPLDDIAAMKMILGSIVSG